MKKLPPIPITPVTTHALVVAPVDTADAVTERAELSVLAPAIV